MNSIKKNLPKYLAELIGTFFLTLAVYLGLAGSGFPPFISAPLTIMLFVYTVGHLSGGHFNPAVTVGLATLRKISLRDAALYLVAQVGGALLGMIVGQVFSGKAGQPIQMIVENTLPVGIAEAIGAFLLVFGVSAVVHKKVDPAASGMVIGGSLLLGIGSALGSSNALLNPAVALGVGAISVAYIVGPLVGGIMAVWMYAFLVRK